MNQPAPTMQHATENKTHPYTPLNGRPAKAPTKSAAKAPAKRVGSSNRRAHRRHLVDPQQQVLVGVVVQPHRQRRRVRVRRQLVAVVKAQALEAPQLLPGLLFCCALYVCCWCGVLMVVVEGGWQGCGGWRDAASKHQEEGGRAVQFTLTHTHAHAHTARTVTCMAGARARPHAHTSRVTPPGPRSRRRYWKTTAATSATRAWPASVG